MQIHTKQGLSIVLEYGINLRDVDPCLSIYLVQLTIFSTYLIFKQGLDPTQVGSARIYAAFLQFALTRVTTKVLNNYGRMRGFVNKIKTQISTAYLPAKYGKRIQYLGPWTSLITLLIYLLQFRCKKGTDISK